MQAQISLFEPMIVDNFAGGGGASTGIEMATGRPVDIAVNHNESAILMHERNHPYTRHYQDDVWILDPLELTGGRPVHIAWFSPDCKHFSRAKGAALVDRNIRGLAWVAVKWAGLVQPDIIIIENVPEFITWGPVRKGKPVKSKAGQTFRKWKAQLEDLGYVVEYGELCAADYGAPTIRTRLVVIARRDGRPIVWPEPTHARRDSAAVLEGRLQPWRAAAEIIDWSLPCYSIFASKQELKEQYGINAIRPLADNTQSRIANGVDKFVISSDEPFIVSIGSGKDNNGDASFAPYVMSNNGANQPHGIREPVPTITTGNRNYLAGAALAPYGIDCNHGGDGHVRELRDPQATITGRCTAGIAAPIITQYHGAKGTDEARGQDLRRPIMTVDGSNRYGLTLPLLNEYYGNGAPLDVRDPLHTVTTKDREGITAVYVDKYFAGGYKGCGNSAREPMTTITAEPRQSIIAAFCSKFYGGVVGSDAKDPLSTVTAIDHNAVAVSHLAHFKGKNTGQSLTEPLRTVTQAEGQFAVIRTVIVKWDGQTDLGYWPQVREMLNRYTKWRIYDDEVLLLWINGAWCFIYDIGLRMLVPRELYNAMGFPPDYIIDSDVYGRPISRKDQVARCGNAVCPPMAAAVVRANCPELCPGEIRTMEELQHVMASQRRNYESSNVKYSPGMVREDHIRRKND